MTPSGRSNSQSSSSSAFTIKPPPPYSLQNFSCSHKVAPLNPTAPAFHPPRHPSSLKRQISDAFVSPSDFFRYDRPDKRHQPDQHFISIGMDKRHPSSFQQLEKVASNELCRSRLNIAYFALAWRGDLCHCAFQCSLVKT